MTGPAAVVPRWWASVRPHRQDLRADALAGLTGAVASVPDGMTSSELAGVNPVYGLHASMTAPRAGGLATSTRLMVITTTGAAALAAGSALEDVDPSERPGALFLLALLAGVLMRRRRRTAAGATFFLVMADYAQRLRTAGGRLYLSGVAPDLAAQIRRAGSTSRGPSRCSRRRTSSAHRPPTPRRRPRPGWSRTAPWGATPTPTDQSSGPNTVDQSSRTLTTVQPCVPARSRASSAPSS